MAPEELARRIGPAGEVLPEARHVALFLLTKLAMTFTFFADEHDAVNNFFPHRALKYFDILDFVQHEEARVLHRELRSDALVRLNAYVPTARSFGPNTHHRR
jgi:hypothetical protein